MKPSDPKKLIAGVIFGATGAIFAVLSHKLGIGELSRLGPGGIPMFLAVTLVVLGAGHMVAAFTSVGSAVEAWKYRATVLVPLSVVCFGLLVDRIGLVPAIVLSTVVAGLAYSRIRFLELLILSVVLAGFCLGIFVYGLNQPFSPFGAK